MPKKTEIGIVITGDNSSFKRSSRQTQNQLKQLKTSASKTKVGFVDLGTAAQRAGGLLLGAFSLREIANLSDSWTEYTNRLRLATRTAGELAEVQQGLASVASDTRQSLSATAELYQRLSQANQNLGLSTSELIDLTETINKTLAISGTGAASAQAALTQLGQAFAAGQLRGEEFNSVVEQAPRLAQALADGLNVGIGTLREMAKQGELTADTVVDALTGQADVIDAEFTRTTATISQAFVVLGNAATEAVGKISDVTGAGNSVAEAVQGWAIIFRNFGDAVQEAFDPTLSQELVKLRREAAELQEAADRFQSGESGFFQLSGDEAAYKRLQEVEKRRLEVLKELRKELDKETEARAKAAEKAKALEDAEQQRQAAARAKAQKELELKRQEREAAVAAKAEAREVKRLYEETLTPLEEYQAKLERIDELAPRLDALGGEGTAQEARDKAYEEYVSSFDDMKEEAKDANEEINQFAASAAQSMQGAFSDFLFDPFDEGIKGMGENFAKIIQRMIADAAAAQIMSSLFGANFGTTGEVGGIIGNFAGGFATGGTMPANSWGVVGENGPEIIQTGSQPAQITPNHKIMGGHTININVTGVRDSGDLKRTAHQIARQTSRAIREAGG